MRESENKQVLKKQTEKKPYKNQAGRSYDMAKVRLFKQQNNIKL